jgi:hypothetical protein
LIHSEKARANFQRQRAELKRQRTLQAGRNPHNDGFEYDDACDPRHAAFLRNKRAKEAAKHIKPNDFEQANVIVPFIRVEKQHTTV